jgi:hypothetical protein
MNGVFSIPYKLINMVNIVSYSVLCKGQDWEKIVRKAATGGVLRGLLGSR